MHFSSLFGIDNFNIVEKIILYIWRLNLLKKFASLT